MLKEFRLNLCPLEGYFLRAISFIAGQTKFSGGILGSIRGVLNKSMLMIFPETLPGTISIGNISKIMQLNFPEVKNLSGIPELNWLLHLGKVAYYRCTNPAVGALYHYLLSLIAWHFKAFRLLLLPLCIQTV